MTFTQWPNPVRCYFQRPKRHSQQVEGQWQVRFLDALRDEARKNTCSVLLKKLSCRSEKKDKLASPESLSNSVHPDHCPYPPSFARGPGSSARWPWLALVLACGCSSEPGPAGVGASGVGGSTSGAVTGSNTVATTSEVSTATSTSVGGATAVTSGGVDGGVDGGTVTGAGGSATTTSGAPTTTSTEGGGTLGSGGASTNDGSSTVASVTTGGNGGSTGAGTTGSNTTGGPLGPTTVWIAGDSTVANGNTPCPAGWGKHFAPYFDDLVTIRNSAVGGRSVRTWLYNVTTEMDSSGECVLMTDGNGVPTLQARWQEMLDGMQPGDALIIQFGINDGSATCDRHVGLKAFKDSCAMMAEAAVSRGAEPIFVTPVSAIACDGATARGTRGAYVDATFEAGAENGVPVIDLHQLSIDLYDELGFCPVPGGDVSASTTGPVGDFFCDDHTHFSDSGAVEIARLVANALPAAGAGLSQHLLE